MIVLMSRKLSFQLHICVKMNVYQNISDIDDNTTKGIVIQGKVIVKSSLLKTKNSDDYFWCIISDKPKKHDLNKTEPNQIKIMVWHPFANTLYKTLRKGNVYDFEQISIKKTYRQYHAHSYQLAITKETKIKKKQSLNVIKNGMLCNVTSNNSKAKLQVNIKHYFKAI